MGLWWLCTCSYCKVCCCVAPRARLAPCKRGRGQSRQDTAQDRVLNCLLLLSVRREAFAGSDSNCRTWANNPKPSPTPSIRTHRPQLLAPCSCCPGSEEQHKAQICLWRAPSTGCRGVEASAIEVPCSITQGSANSLRLYKPGLLSCRADRMVLQHPCSL